MKEESKISNKAGEKSRLREIISVLRRNKVYKAFTPVKFKNVMEELGPTFIKLGQLLSVREDMLPVEYCRELALLRTQAAVIPLDEIRSVIEAEYQMPMEEVFDGFDGEPLGSASIAQVHTAFLKNTEQVVIKVQRPGIFEVMEKDIVLLKKAAGIINFTGVTKNVLDLKGVLDEIWNVAKQEMDFITEADNLEEFASCNKDIIYVTVPEVKRSMTTRHLLVMEYIDGIPIDDTAVLMEYGYDLKEIGIKLAENYVKQVMDDAFFHADPHPGNVRIRDGKIVWLDLGMTGRLSKKDQEILRRTMFAIVQNDVNAVKDSLLALGTPKERIDHIRLYEEIDELLARYTELNMRDINLSRMLEDLFGLVKRHQIMLPDNVTMLGRGMMLIQSTLAVLDPDISFMEILANHVKGTILAFDDKSVQKLINKGVKKIIAAGEKSLDVPANAADLLKMTLKGRTKINVEQSFSHESFKKADFIVNKIIMGFILGTLIIASSIMASSGVGPKIWGFPVIAMIGYIICAIDGIYLWRKMRK